MKKIFLTSGLVICMACPAFADFTGDETLAQLATACDQTHLGVTSGPTTMKAKWTAKKYTVTYEVGDHADSNSQDYDDTDGAEWGQNYTALTAATTGIAADTGYVFLGYVEDGVQPSITRTGAAAGTLNNAWAGQSPWATDDDVTVVAAYLPKQYTVTYACGDGTPVSGETLTNTATYGESYTHLSAATICSNPGYGFDSWNCVETGSDPEEAVTVGSTWSIDAAVTCTATWSGNSISPITWNGDNADSSWVAPTGVAGTNSCTYGGSITLPTAPTKTGYEFAGWEALGAQDNQTEP